jgi:predicted secreted hydrolase
MAPEADCTKEHPTDKLFFIKMAGEPFNLRIDNWYMFCGNREVKRERISLAWFFVPLVLDPLIQAGNSLLFLRRSRSNPGRRW